MNFSLTDNPSRRTTALGST